MERGAVEKELRFVAQVQTAGINPYVHVPERVVQALGGGTHIPVLVKVVRFGSQERAPAQNTRRARGTARLDVPGRMEPGGWFRSTLMPQRSQEPRLYLNFWMRDAAHVGVGDRVRVTLKRDLGTRDLSMPISLRWALDSDPAANAAWEALTPSRRREILSYLNSLNSHSALERSVRKVVASLTPGRRSRF
jgi:hypothetical protein